MKFYVLTLFPEMIDTIMSTSIIGRAKEKSLFETEIINIRDFSNDKHRRVDDYPYGGGAGMLMQCEPIYNAYKDICTRSNKKTVLLYTSPQGRVFDQNMAKELAAEEDLIILCGHYEGVDERVLELTDAIPVSIGDYVLTGGELPAMVMIDSISRMLDGVLSNKESKDSESFENNLLEYPQYTRPEVFMDKKVPDVLLSGHHKNIEIWKKEESIKRTLERRPDLLEKAELNPKEKLFLENLKKNV